jgi:hypothetical protein
MEPSRYTSVFDETERKWKVKDRESSATFGQFDTKRQSDRRATQLQVRHNERRRQDYGMRHPINAPPARAYKD